MFDMLLSMMGQSGKGGSGGVSFLIMMGLMFVIMYFIVIRPQVKQRKKLQAEIAGVKKGDKILTSGGLYATIVGVKEGIVVIQIAKDVKVELNRNMVSKVFPKA